MAGSEADDTAPVRTRVPAAERRAELISAAVHEFASGGLHGTPVADIARRVGVAQPYVFSLFATKRELFLAAVERSFALVAQTFESHAAEFAAGRIEAPTVFAAMGRSYMELLRSDRDWLMLQHQAYAACNDDVVREHVRRHYAALVELVRRLSGAPDEQVDDFFRYGMWLNVAAAMGVDDLSAGGSWICETLGQPPD
jgi:AcrR family transcriptional regulator